MATLQVKGMDERLYKALRARAEADKRSISQEVVYIIELFLSRPSNDHRAATDALIELAGTWQDERTASQIAADIRKARRTSKRFSRNHDVFD